MVTKKTTEERYREKLRPQENGCIGWGASIDKYGNAKFTYTDGEGVHRTTSGHKFGWVLEHGEVPKGYKLKNICGLLSCQQGAHWRLTGDGKGLTLQQRYEARFTRLGPDECWPWQEKSRDKDGYGLLGYRQEGRTVTVRATRLGWDLAHPEDPLEPSQVVCHTCDYPPCQNPAHWFKGVTADNNADMMAKGRHWAPGAEAHYRAKLSWDDVYEIRRRAERGESQQALADVFGMSREAISKIVRLQRWVPEQDN